MSTTELSTISLHGTKKGIIKISDIVEPYGAGSNDVVSIGITLNGSDVSWKAHIPYENIDELIEHLQKAKAAKK
ncbi:MAG: hypothetical protein HRT41_13025 [Campylobacteraceae bacterium]|nr:hypothetical protein [Campylobacteraceae bacterium]